MQSSGSQKIIVILTNSALSNLDRRRALRNSWLKYLSQEPIQQRYPHARRCTHNTPHTNYFRRVVDHFCSGLKFDFWWEAASFPRKTPVAHISSSALSKTSTTTSSRSTCGSARTASPLSPPCGTSCTATTTASCDWTYCVLSCYPCLWSAFTGATSGTAKRESHIPSAIPPIR